MKILVVTNFYPPHHFGGYELSCADTVVRFRERGHDVVVLTSDFRRPGVQCPTAEPSVRRDLALYWRDQQPWDPGLCGRLALERHNQVALEAALEVSQPDVVSVWNLGAASTCLLTTLVRQGRPLVYHVCNDWLSVNLVVDRWLTQFRDRRWLARLVERVTATPTDLPNVGRSGTFCWVSRSTWAQAEKNTPWTFPDSIVVHSGIDTTDFPLLDPPVEARPWGGRLLFVGRLEWGKGVETIIDALVHLPPDWSLDIVGPGEPAYVNHLHLRASDRGVSGRYRISEVPRSELRRFYAAADAFIFPSTTEPFGLVPIEAMACGTPVVASGVGGSAEFLSDGVNCLLFTPGDGPGLASTLLRLSADPSLRSGLVQGGAKTAEEYTVDRLADRLEEAHLSAIHRARGRA